MLTTLFLAATLTVSAAPSDAERNASSMMNAKVVNASEAGKGGARIVFLGNSITLHGCLPSIGWTNVWGMAASAKEKDYVHLVTRAIEARTGGKAEVRVNNLALFERNYRTWNVEGELANLAAFAPDYLVIALGENVPNLATADDQEAYRAAFDRLLARFLSGKKRPQAVVRGVFWANAVKDRLMRSVAESYGVPFVRADVGGEPGMMAVGLFKHPGVQHHPGDRGMREIADRILEGLFPAGPLKVEAGVYSVPAGENIYGGYAVTVDGTVAPVSEVRVSAMPFNRRWPGHQRQLDQTELAGMVRFAFKDRARVTVRPTKPFKSVKVRPLSRKVQPVVKDGAVTFDLVQPGGYSVEFDDYHNNLHVLADAPANYGIRSTAANVRYFGPGEHDVGIVNLKDGETVYLDPGAVVYGMFHASNRTDVAILGRGILDASRIKEKILFPAKGDGKEDCHNAERWHTIHFIDCRGCRVDGITLRDSLCYNIGFWGCEDIDIRNVKIVGQWRFNTDGIDLHNCRRGRVRDCFARCFDDVYCFKAHLYPGTDCEDLVFENCIAWADWGKCFEVGVECRADHLRRLKFVNCDCIRGSGTILDVANVDWGEVSDVTFQDIRVELDDPLPPGRVQKSDEDRFEIPTVQTEGPLLFGATISFHHEYSVEKGGKFKGAGKINGVTLRNIDVISKYPLRSLAKGFGKGNEVKGLVFDNVSVNGKRVQAPKDLGFMQGPFSDLPSVK